MLRIGGLVLAAAAAAFLGGCATLTNEQCVRGDWYGIGLADGQAGEVATRIESHRRACADTPASIDVAAWEAGRAAGLRSYCTPANGYEIGTRGRSAGTVCPADLAPGFQSGHALGTRVAAAEQEVRNAEAALGRLRSEQAAAAERSRALLVQIAAANDPAVRGPLVIELAGVQARERMLRDDQQRAVWRLDDARADAARVRATTLASLQDMLAGG